MKNVEDFLIREKYFRILNEQFCAINFTKTEKSVTSYVIHELVMRKGKWNSSIRAIAQTTNHSCVTVESSIRKLLQMKVISRDRNSKNPRSKFLLNINFYKALRNAPKA